MRHSKWAFPLAFCLTLTACQPIQLIDTEGATSGIEQSHADDTPIDEVGLGPDAAEFPKVHAEWTTYTDSSLLIGMIAHGGWVWTATAGGVVRWDARSGEYVKLTTDHGLPTNRVDALAMGPDGAMWFATSDSISGEGKGVIRLGRDGSWSTYTTADGLATNLVEAIAAGVDGSLWFGTGGGVSRYKPAQ